MQTDMGLSDEIIYCECIRKKVPSIVDALKIETVSGRAQNIPVF